MFIRKKIYITIIVVSITFNKNNFIILKCIENILEPFCLYLNYMMVV